MTTDHIKQTIGGFKGHVFRRLVHFSLATIPVVYYSYGPDTVVSLSVNLLEFVSCIFLAILVMEVIRLKFRIVLVGQRHYESTQISAFAWGAFSIWLTILITSFEPFTSGSGLETGLYGIPIIFGLVFVDPIIGEIRRIRGAKLAIVVGTSTSYIVWISCYFWLGTPLWIGLLLAPLTVLGELPSIRYVDDNATIILLPLGALLLLSPLL